MIQSSIREQSQITTKSLQGASPQVILRQIDAIIHELETLRTSVVTMLGEADSSDLTQQLFGVLGQGTWTEYDPDLDWQRFER